MSGERYKNPGRHRGPTYLVCCPGSSLLMSCLALRVASNSSPSFPPLFLPPAFPLPHVFSTCAKGQPQRIHPSSAYTWSTHILRFVAGSIGILSCCGRFSIAEAPVSRAPRTPSSRLSRRTLTSACPVPLISRLP